MSDLLAWMSEIVHAHQGWAGPIVGLLVFAESLAFIGFLVPSTALLLLIGGLMGAGLVDGLPILLWALAGAVMGDAVSFWAGRWAGPRALLRPALARYRRLLVRARLFFRRYGALAVILGRFIGPVRSMIPFAAGMFRMRELRFQVANVAGAVLWLPAMFAPGWLGGKGLTFLGRYGEGAGLAGLVAPVLATAAGRWLWRRRKLRKRRPDRRERGRNKP